MHLSLCYVMDQYKKMMHAIEMQIFKMIAKCLNVLGEKLGYDKNLQGNQLTLFEIHG